MRAAAPNSQCPLRRGKFGHVRILLLSHVQPSPENGLIYRAISAADPDIVRLAESIREHGVLEPLVVTRDGYILSGHRRHFAARLAGLSKVPCRVDGVTRDDKTFRRRLVEHNQQRVKGVEEIFHEELLRADSQADYEQLLSERIARAQVDGDGLNVIELRDRKDRPKISAAKLPMLNAVARILDENREYWPLTDRQVHYYLLNNPPLIHASKPDSTYRNHLKCYKSLTDLLTRARLEGHVPWAAISDATRPVTVWDVHDNPAGFISREIEEFLKGYSRNLLQSQPNHIEVIGEKNTIMNVIRPICMNYCVPYSIGRGYCSLDPRAKLVRRFTQSGKEKLVLLALSDFDPDGEEIAHSFARSLRDDFCIDEGRIIPVKVALSLEQVEELALPPIMTAKEGSANYDRFVEAYGAQVHELEAAPPGELQRFLSEAIHAVLDVELYNAEVEAERRDASYLAAARSSLQQAFTNLPR
jgi:hypothetical protein